MDNIKLMQYWINSSDEDFDAMKVMYKNKKNTWTLFLGHLVIEKLLKGLYAKKNKENPYTVKSHNLLVLAEKCKLDLTDGEIEKLQIITQFNISARYDDYKESFRKKCTDEYTSKQVKNIEEVRKWLKEILMKE
jgi:HEPN domain-containing protein